MLLLGLLLLSGVFFPLEQLPASAQAATQVLPLAHAVALIRPIMLGRPVDNLALHLIVLGAYAAVALVVALVLLRRRLLR